VVIADLDHFKAINDTYGHFAGDSALQEAAHRMQASIRTYDAIGRYGGEEFLVVLPGADEQSTRLQAERMRHALRSKSVHTSEASLNVTCSFGCSAGMGGRATADSLIGAADGALYRAKRAGRDCCVVASVPHIAHPAMALAAGDLPVSYSLPETD